MKAVARFVSVGFVRVFLDPATQQPSNPSDSPGRSQRSHHLQLPHKSRRAGTLEERCDSLVAIVDIHDAQRLLRDARRLIQELRPDPLPPRLPPDGELRKVPAAGKDDRISSLVAHDYVIVGGAAEGGGCVLPGGFHVPPEAQRLNGAKAQRMKRRTLSL